MENLHVAGAAEIARRPVTCDAAGSAAAGRSSQPKGLGGLSFKSEFSLIGDRECALLGGGSPPGESAVAFDAWRWRMLSFEASMVYDFPWHLRRHVMAVESAPDNMYKNS